jgi:signal transduction histidine kinase
MFQTYISFFRKNRFLILPLFIIILVIVFVLLVRSYFSETISAGWESVSSEKKSEVSENCTKVFYKYQDDLSSYSLSIASDKKFVNAIRSQSSKKIYDAFFEIAASTRYSAEIYNSQFELLFFNGRQLNPEILELKKAARGTRFSVVKEIGLYTFLIIYEPIIGDGGEIAGVLASGIIIDVNSSIQNRYFENSSITGDIFNDFHINVTFSFNEESRQQSNEQRNTGNITRVSIKGIDNTVLGTVNIPSLDKESYLNGINMKFNNLISFLLFIVSFIIVTGTYRYLKRISSNIARVLILLILLILSRYFWLYIGFPSNFFSDFGSEFFSPGYYASGFGFGIARSLGELVITSIVILTGSYLILKQCILFYRNEKMIGRNYLLLILISALTVTCSFIAVHLYGIIIQSIIYDSTIKFIDKTDLFSLNQPELIFARLSLIILSAALLFLLYSAGLIFIKYTSVFLSASKLVRKNSAVIFTAILLVFIPIVSFTVIELSMSNSLVLLVIIISGLFLLFLQRKLNSTRKYKFVNISTLSMILLSCTIFIPVIILTKISSQENRYLEKSAREISQRNEDKVSFLVTSTLDELSTNEDLIKEINNKNKIGNLAFTLWSNSSLNDEDVNSAIIILDSNKKMTSDFSIIPSELNSDTVISYVLSEMKKIKKLAEPVDEASVSDSLESGFENVSTIVQNEPGLLDNKEMKYYAGISELTPAETKRGRFEEKLGYIIVVCSYDSKNYLRQGNLSLFRNFARENILNKLTSNPVFSEFSDGDLVGSSNKDISKTFIKSLPAFRESVKDKSDMSALRYDRFENESYKSFYILNKSYQGTPEKIFIVSVKVNDFALSTFFFFRYLLFSASVYLVILLIYILARLYKYISNRDWKNILKFGFREKLFASFLIASIVPIIILALYTREYVKTKNEESYRNQLISDLRLVEQYVKNRIQSIIKPEKGNKKESNLLFTDVFGKELSESNKNFNLYIKNKITSTTSEQLYKSDLLDARISGNAYYNISLLKKDFYSENQQIGDFTFIVGYKPVFDLYNNLTGIISSQTVFKQNEINQELTESMVYILGPYISAVILLIFIVNVLAYRISNPILKLQKATEQLSRGIIDIEVRSNSSDEIGDLVKSFNRMVKELKRTQAELKKAERETAWRDIARQVAHEIKNPLTPMKLAMQHMFKAYSSGSENFESIIKSTNKMIIDQVETLNKIATEFSNFAKLPGRNYEQLNIDDILKDVAHLMNTRNNIELKLEPRGHHRITGDKDEVKRAIINIIKNSLQAIDEKTTGARNGKIIISSEKRNGFYHLKVKDNGQGMDEEVLNKLFEPYFSTKSSGMGLGLVITKKILDDMKAKINVSSRAGEGTEIEIVFKMK